MAAGLGFAALAGFAGASFVARELRGHSASRAPAVIPVATSAWEIRAFGAGGKVPGSEKRKIARGGSEVASIVRSLYDALLFGRGDLEKVARAHFTAPAAAALAGARIRLPSGLRDVAVSTRSANIGIQARGAARAGVRVNVALQGTNDEGLVRLSHRATLWLERQSGRWRVIGFDVNQKPTLVGSKG